MQVVGWAVNDALKLQGSVDGIDVYMTADRARAPECDPRCGRFFHQYGDYSACARGVKRHYGESLNLCEDIRNSF